MSISLTGQKIALLETQESDIPTVMKLEQENQEFIGACDHAGHLKIIQDANGLHLTIFDLSNDEFAGFILLNDTQSPHRSIELKRIVIDTKGKGLGREALQLCKRLCFEQLNAHSIWLDVFDDNVKAIGLYESEGFVFEGKRRECFLDEKGFRSQRIYSILESEYKAPK